GANSVYGKEHEEARKVVTSVIQKLQSVGQRVVNTTCDCHGTQGSILKHQADLSNAQNRNGRLDVSVHFNSFNGNANGVEVLYFDQQGLASKMSEAIAKAGGFNNRGAKQRTDLYFLKNTDAPAILIEVCFIDNANDMEKYRTNFDTIVNSIVNILTGKQVTSNQPINQKQEVKSQPQVSNNSIGVATVKVNELNVRTGSGANYPIAQGSGSKGNGKVYKGESYKVFAIKDGWYNVGKNQWISNVKNAYCDYKPNGQPVQVAKPTSQSKATKKVHLPASASTWRLYPTNKSPVKGNEKAFLKPSKFGGLSYEIIGNPQPNVYTIKTGQFGVGNVYAHPSTGAIVK
ncbi:MAG TPA: N-acetylmuramoyl-L-alanine amidase, partial [Bacteroidales bacterium]|nr:N-acetylmuramoyl-L-alanine amidase [Bacteroidales bacterium]